ncbi:hypothetical protein [Estrella lausannensis]|uniref:Uncharacterized protein n=1 Tax=Estrella lausannensis TaxID=483423 RepID=A0A0H5E3G8_9BACT|nr:hypothetical protein [Estrella lausannensis]CRX37760.1 hypothetical protein ELAC_0399 [Estrella lausannensis]
MSYSGLDSSFYRPGGNYQLERQLSQDFELGALEQKMVSGRVAPEDTIDVALYLGQSYGRNATVASHPTLEFPIWNLRASAPDFQPPPEVWGPVYDGLLDLLPADIKGKLLEEMAKPYGERQDGFNALQNLLETAAKFMVMIELAARDIGPDSSAAKIREAYLNLPLESLTNLEGISSTVLSTALELLQGEGFAA